jgi:hypothetical protein
VGGKPLKKGVIQPLYAGTGRESRTISGPRAAAERDHVESATPAGGRWERAGTGQGRSPRPGLERGCLRRTRGRSGPLEGGEPTKRSERGGRLDGEVPIGAALQGATQGHGL